MSRTATGLAVVAGVLFALLAAGRDLAAATSEEQVARGDVITRQGEPSFDVFFIIAGTFDVSISHAGHAPDFIRTLSAGDSFGELGVLYDVPRTATVRCTTAGHVLRIPGQTFLDALDTGA